MNMDQNAPMQSQGAQSGQSEMRSAPRCSPPDYDESLCGPLPLAMAYVPMQAWRDLYEPAEGMHNGTIFRELNLPFMGSDRGAEHE